VIATEKVERLGLGPFAVEQSTGSGHCTMTNVATVPLTALSETVNTS
jgi:hypothetical protein